MACDPTWNIPKWNYLKPNSIEQTLLGSGYYTSTFDGYSDVSIMATKLDNDDILVSYFNCFYHK